MILFGKEGYHGWKARATKQRVAPNGTRVNKKNWFILKDSKLLLGGYNGYDDFDHKL